MAIDLRAGMPRREANYGGYGLYNSQRYNRNRLENYGDAGNILDPFALPSQRKPLLDSGSAPILSQSEKPFGKPPAPVGNLPYINQGPQPDVPYTGTDRGPPTPSEPSSQSPAWGFDWNGTSPRNPYAPVVKPANFGSMSPEARRAWWQTQETSQGENRAWLQQAQSGALEDLKSKYASFFADPRVAAMDPLSQMSYFQEQRPWEYGMSEQQIRDYNAAKQGPSNFNNNNIIGGGGGNVTPPPGVNPKNGTGWADLGTLYSKPTQQFNQNQNTPQLSEIMNPKTGIGYPPSPRTDVPTPWTGPPQPPLGPPSPPQGGFMGQPGRVPTPWFERGDPLQPPGSPPPHGDIFPGLDPNRVWTGGSRDFDESTGQYRNRGGSGLGGW